MQWFLLTNGVAGLWSMHWVYQDFLDTRFRANSVLFGIQSDYTSQHAVCITYLLSKQKLTCMITALYCWPKVQWIHLYPSTYSYTNVYVWLSHLKLFFLNVDIVITCADDGHELWFIVTTRKWNSLPGFSPLVYIHIIGYMCGRNTAHYLFLWCQLNNAIEHKWWQVTLFEIFLINFYAEPYTYIIHYFVLNYRLPTHWLDMYRVPVFQCKVYWVVLAYLRYHVTTMQQLLIQRSQEISWLRQLNQHHSLTFWHRTG